MHETSLPESGAPKASSRNFGAVLAVLSAVIVSVSMLGRVALRSSRAAASLTSRAAASLCIAAASLPLNTTRLPYRVSSFLTLVAINFGTALVRCVIAPARRAPRGPARRDGARGAER